MKATPRPRNRQPCERTTEVKNNTDDNAVLSYRLFECIVLAQTWAHWDIVKRKKQKQKKEASTQAITLSAIPTYIHHRYRWHVKSFSR